MDGRELASRDDQPYLGDPWRRLFLERHVTNVEKALSHLFPQTGEYSNAEHFSKLLGPSPGEVHLAPRLDRYASSTGSIGGDESCLSDPSWTNSHLCASPEQTPLPSPLPSPSNYPEPLGSHSPMIGTAGALFHGDALVLPQDLQHYPETLDVSPQYTGTHRSVPYRAELWTENFPPYEPPPVDPALYEPYETDQPPRKRSRQSQSIHTSLETFSQPSAWPSGSNSSDANTTPEKTQPSRTSSKKKSSPRNKRTSPQGRHATNGVVFPCAFAPFGCTQTFTAKNEWKRHVATIHLQLGVYICDLGYCSHAPARQGMPYPLPSPKTYNRKDLFTQHLRRMHASPPANSNKTKLTPDEEAALDAFTRSTSERCFVPQRAAPSYSQCPYCSVEFSGPEIWDERMEHVARHVEAGAARVREDEGLREWAVREGVVVAVEQGKKGNGKGKGADGGYVLVEKGGGRKRKA